MDLKMAECSMSVQRLSLKLENSEKLPSNKIKTNVQFEISTLKSGKPFKTFCNKMFVHPYKNQSIIQSEINN